MSQFNPSWMAGDARNPSNMHLNLTQLEVSVELNYAQLQLLFYHPFISKSKRLELLSTCLSCMFVPMKAFALQLPAVR